MIDAERCCEIKDEETLRAVVEHWQRILRLADWHVEAHLVAEHEFNDFNRVGVAYADLPRRCAQIFLLRAETRLERWKAHDGTLYYGRKPMEVDVVHELLHIWTKQCVPNEVDKDSKWYLAMEQMTESLATALCELHSYFGDAVSAVSLT